MPDPSINVPENEPTVNVTVVAPESLWRAMKRRAIDERDKSASDLWVAAAREYLRQQAMSEDAT
jgi:3-oxoacyl-[acyl-carrier-protein] synthase III